MSEKNENQQEESSDEATKAETGTFAPDYSGDFPTYYANLGSVSHSPYDLCIDFCTIAPPHKISNNGGNLFVGAPVTVRVVVPPEMAEGLIEALQTRLERYQEEKGEGRMTVVQPKKDQSDA